MILENYDHGVSRGMYSRNTMGRCFFFSEQAEILPLALTQLEALRSFGQIYISRLNMIDSSLMKNIFDIFLMSDLTIHLILLLRLLIFSLSVNNGMITA